MSIEFWIFLAVIAILLEALTTNSFLISLGIGAVGAVAADYFGYDLTVQIIVFIIVSIICIFLSFRISKRLNEDHDAIKSNQEGLIGKEGTVKEEIPKNEVGMVVVDGKDYVATSYENINENSQVKVIDNDDLMLIELAEVVDRGIGILEFHQTMQYLKKKEVDHIADICSEV